jgi:dTDP-4-dehydrorhamnose 3,5-epimerase-like enzyme
MKLQNYNKQPTIEGVKVIDLKQFNDDGGSFVELCRLQEDDYEDEKRRAYIDFLGEADITSTRWQINHSRLEKDVIKGFHLHKKQTDVWYVMDRSIVILFDLRPHKDFHLENVSSHFKRDLKSKAMKIITGDKPKLITIPPWVAHGIFSPYGPVNMIYFVNRFFDENDEFRISWDYLGEDIWEIQKG